MKAERAVYRSPLREAQATATRNQILDAVATVIEAGDEPTYPAIAEVAGVQERTVFRHFPTREELFQAFWARVHAERMQVTTGATDLESLMAMVGEAFAGFERQAPLVRAMLHSTHGRAIRLSTNEGRRRSHEGVAAAEVPELDGAARRRAAAAAQVLCSAMAWEYLTDYWEMSSSEAAATVQQALTAMFRGLRGAGQGPRGAAKKRKDER